jgi:hypothetical protein
MKNQSNLGNQIKRFDVEFGLFNLTYRSRPLAQLEKFSIQFAYGHREILLDYMGLERTNIFVGIIQHGVSQEGLTPEFPFTSDNRTPRVGLMGRSPLWVYSDKTKVHLKKNGIKNVEAIGAPWNYISHEDLRQDVVEAVKGTESYLVLPEHFNFEVKANISSEQVRLRIAHWRKIAGGCEITLCLFWTEYLDPILQRVCREEGVKVVTAGNGATSPLWSPHASRINFLYELSQIMQQHTHCIVERETSAAYYAMSLGLHVGYFPDTHPFRDQIDTGYHNLFQARFPGIINSFLGPDDLKEISDEWLGSNCVRSPDELMSILQFEFSPIDF